MCRHSQHRSSHVTQCECEPKNTQLRESGKPAVQTGGSNRKNSNKGGRAVAGNSGRIMRSLADFRFFRAENWAFWAARSDVGCLLPLAGGTQMHASTLSPRASPVRLSISFVPLALVSTRHAAGPGSSSSGANSPAPRPAKLGAALGKNKMGRGEVDNARFAQARAPPRPPPRARELRGRPRYRGKR